MAVLIVSYMRARLTLVEQEMTLMQDKYTFSSAFSMPRYIALEMEWNTLDEALSASV